HGDLKPGNVLLTEGGRVKLTDFGIAHVIDPLRRDEHRGLQGTPYYMAPEQLVDVASIGPSTDLYAIGVMLYELLSGREPYPWEGSLAQIFARKIGPIDPLDSRAGVAIPPELAELVTSLLDPNPRTRPRFAARVRGVLADIAKHCSDARTGGLAANAGATWIDPPIGSEPTLVSPGLATPASTGRGTRSLPFSLPSTEGATPDVALHRLRPLPLVGRTGQTARLLADAAEVAAVGGARGVIVSGRAGEGKTRVVRHGFAEVERTGSMLGVAASFDETIANAEVGLRACMSRLLGAPADTLADTVGGPWQWLARAPQPGVDFARMHEWLAPKALALDAGAAADVAAMCVLAASRVFPVYLWLDDVGWSHDGAMELFVRLLERNDARVLVVGTLRSGTAEHPAVRAWLLDAARAGARLEMLPPLHASDRKALVGAVGPVAPDVAEALGAQLDEPPLVVVETVRSWIDDGELVASDRGYVLRAGQTAAALAARAQGGVLARRIETIISGFGDDAGNAERALCHAALLGLRFEERALRACGGSMVDRVLDRALLTGLLRVDGRRAYRFEHRLFLDAIVERCALRPDASEIYCATADALTAIHGPRALEGGFTVASLYRFGGRHEAAARRIVENVRALARASLLAETDREIETLAQWNEADAIPPGHLHGALLDLARGQRAYFALDYDAALNHLLSARATFEALGSTTDLHTTVLDLSSVCFFQDRFLEAERWIASIETTAVGDPLARARMHHRLAELSWMRSDLARAVAHEEQYVELAVGVEPRSVFIGLLTLADLHIACGAIPSAVAVAERANAMTDELADRFLSSELGFTLASLDAARGYYAAARVRVLHRMEELGARDDKWSLTRARATLLLCDAAAGVSPAGIEQRARELVASFAAVPHDEPVTWWMIREAAGFLRKAGHDALAADVSGVLDARLEKIARAFKEDAAAR
ncbi:MAG TPA: protein kinase, partial [Polyangiaceae bacterium]